MSSSDKLTGLITRFQLMTLLCKGVIRDALETDQVIDLQVMIKELSDVYSMSGTCRVVGIIFTKTKCRRRGIVMRHTQIQN